ncbi:ribonuclease domain-containing protein [Clostridiaceae bacterium HSG29]|nr:ribonuclease domain-containing protein [Clostridiaceae bacterium HSG29]
MNKKFLYLLIILVLIGSLFGCNNPDDVVADRNSNTVVDDSNPNDVLLDDNLTINDEENSSLTLQKEFDSNDNLTICDEETTIISEDGYYSTPEDVSEYIFIYGQLPDNYIKKNDAISKGWNSREGNLWDVTDKMSIGGDYFGNREGLLPKVEGRKYSECDINYSGGYRGAERIVFSNDGLIFYTKDHYKSFKQLY